MSTAKWKSMLLGACLMFAAPAQTAASETSASPQQKLDSYARELRLLHVPLSLKSLVRFDPQTLQLQSGRLKRDHRPLLVHLWSVYCTACVIELPALPAFAQAIAAETGTHFVLAVEDPMSVVTEESRRRPLKLPALEHYVVSASSGLRAELQENSQPLTLLIDRNGVVRQAFIGSIVHRKNELLSALSRFARSQARRDQ